MNEIRQYIASKLSVLYQGDELNALIWWILEEMSSKNRAILLAQPELTDFTELKPRIDGVITRLLRHEPIQYIFGHTEWNGLDWKVTPDVLIPRPETAEIIGLVESREIRVERLRILDIGTGSGCLAITLKKRFPDAEVIGIDISEAALKVARLNAERNNADVQFVKADAMQLGIYASHGYNVLETDSTESARSEACATTLMSLDSCLSTPFSLIVSNPPYIAESEKAGMDANVVDYEPHSALFVPDDDPLVFYRAIAQFAANHLAQQGILVVEINQRFGKEVSELMRSVIPNANVELCVDDYGNHRFVIVSKI